MTEVYQVETFKVPASSSSRLVFSTDYQDTHQTSVLHVALFEPDGTYAGVLEPPRSSRLRGSRGGQPADRQMDGALLH